MISLEEDDLSKEPDKLRIELSEIFPLKPGNEVLFSLKAMEDISIHFLNLVFSFAKETKKQKAKIILNIKPELNQKLKMISSEDIFDSILVEEN